MHAVLGVATAAAVFVSAQVHAPALTVVRPTPLTLRGTGFRPGEPVRLTLTIRRRRAAVATKANAAGAFTARFPLLIATDPCRGTIVVLAVGSGGSRATWKRECRTPDPQP